MSSPAAAPVWLKELDEERGQLPMDRAVLKLRDEITGVTMTRTLGQNRELAMALAKLDEARLWIIAYMETTAEVQIIPRAQLLRAALTDTTDKTVTDV